MREHLNRYEHENANREVPLENFVTVKVKRLKKEIASQERISLSSHQITLIVISHVCFDFRSYGCSSVQ